MENNLSVDMTNEEFESHIVLALKLQKRAELKAFVQGLEEECRKERFEQMGKEPAIGSGFQDYIDLMD